ncbi:hypothetical protein QYE76_021094, partial [Lolium multiflorum]
MMEFANKVQRKYDTMILAIRSDNGMEFKNYTLDDFLGEEGIQHQYSSPYTPQQNGVSERKNRTLIEAARTMMMEYKSKFEMSMMGELKYFLGFEIKQMQQGTFINQAKYLQDMLKRFDMKGANGIGTPMHLKCQLTLDETGKAVDPKLYRSMIGSLLYLCAARPDIMLSVGMCARFQANPKESHIMAVKRIFRYLVDTPNFGLWYPRDTNFSLVGFTDSDWAGDKVDRKSTSGACHFLGRSLVCWSSKKQNCVSVSTAEA